MEKVKKRLIHLCHCRGIGPKSMQLFYEYDPSFRKFFHMNYTEIIETFPIPKKQAATFYEDLQNMQMSEILRRYEEEKVELVTIFDSHYPPLLKHIYDPPWTLFCKGKLSFLKNLNLLSIVGTRDASANGYKILQTLLPYLIENDWSIVSGLAKGIDTFAHQITLQLKGKAIAVLGSGFDYIYPAQNKQLAQQLFTEHLMLSEYPPHFRPQKWMFPRRNRIISGLSRGTLVVEAKERSGSFITADYALEQGRDVFAVPGSIFEERSIGTNRLIQMGAKLVMNGKDILEEFESNL